MEWHWEAIGDWTSVGCVPRDLMSDQPTKFQLDRRFQEGTFAFRVFADNRAALSVPLDSEWITPDLIGGIRLCYLHVLVRLK